MLRFDRWDVFLETFEPYRQWVACWDMPDFGLREGDHVLEISPEREATGVWDGCRFQSRTSSDGYVIDNIDDFRAEDLFYGGLPPWPLEGDVLVRVSSALADLIPLGKAVLADALRTTTVMVKRMEENAPKGRPLDGGARYLTTGRPGDVARLRALVPNDGHEAAWVALQDVPDTPVRAGDILIKLSRYRNNAEPDGLRGSGSRVPRASLRVIADQLEHAFQLIEISRDKVHGTRHMKNVATSLRMAGRPGWRDATSPLIILRPLVAPVSEPIEASSDDSAIFELLCQAGCTMPGREETT